MTTKMMPFRTTRQSSLAVFAGMIVLAMMQPRFGCHAQTTTNNNNNNDDCSMEIWVFDTLDRCNNVNPPNAVGTIYADGQCRSTEVLSSTNATDYGLFPGNYRAQCTTENKIRFVESGCLTDTCESTSIAENPVCDRDFGSISGLYSRLSPPEYILQNKSAITAGSYFTCLKLNTGNGLSVTFVVFGDCNSAACQVVPAPVATSAPGSTPQTPTPPATAPTTTAPLAPTTTPAPTPPTDLPADTIVERIRVGMRLSPMAGTLSEGTNEQAGLKLWNTATRKQIEESAVREAAIGAVTKVLIEDVTQTLLSSGRMRRRRSLQDGGGNALLINFELEMTYSVVENMEKPSVSNIYKQSFDTEQDRITYLLKLVSDSDFKDVRTIEALVGGSSAIDVPADEQEGSAGNGILIGSIVGVSAAVSLGIAAALFMFRGGKNNKKNSMGKRSKDTPSTNGELYGSTQASSGVINSQAQRWTNEILVNTEADDVSTLGGSVLAGLNIENNAGAAGDEPTASVHGDYDFDKQQYRIEPSVADHTRLTHATGFSMFSKLGMLGESLFADDQSFEQQFVDDDEAAENMMTDDETAKVRPFEVRAPPGMLGMVVDTPNGGVPVVRAIKPDSVLSGRVQVGDRLISVDHQDVTSMSALEVSSLISLKQNSPRLLVFVRLPKK